MQHGGDYTIRNVKCLEMGRVEHISLSDKNYGSNLTGLEMGLARLQQLLVNRR